MFIQEPGTQFQLKFIMQMYSVVSCRVSKNFEPTLPSDLKYFAPTVESFRNVFKNFSKRERNPSNVLAGAWRDVV